MSGVIPPHHTVSCLAHLHISLCFSLHFPILRHTPEGSWSSLHHTDEVWVYEKLVVSFGASAPSLSQIIRVHRVLSCFFRSGSCMNRPLSHLKATHFCPRTVFSWMQMMSSLRLSSAKDDGQCCLYSISTDSSVLLKTTSRDVSTIYALTALAALETILVCLKHVSKVNRTGMWYQYVWIKNSFKEYQPSITAQKAKLKTPEKL
jgi:hypothetical protein